MSQPKDKDENAKKTNHVLDTDIDPSVIAAAQYYRDTEIAEIKIARNHLAANRRMERHLDKLSNKDRKG